MAANCRSCETGKAKLCPGREKGFFCTEMMDSEELAGHPAVRDIQGPASCEIVALYEGPAIRKTRRGKKPR